MPSLFSRLFRTSGKRKTYADLLLLDDHLLADIGLSRGDVSQLAYGRNRNGRTVSHE